MIIVVKSRTGAEAVALQGFIARSMHLHVKENSARHLELIYLQDFHTAPAGTGDAASPGCRHL